MNTLPCGGYETSKRNTCACGRRCECAGDTRCNSCQEAAFAALKERVRLGVAGGAKARAEHARAFRARQRDLGC
jgi:hypothetical protein